ncbi:unnamed protein product [Thelazia callipaeda]|uniref:Ground-like domain-containing protein n=1 Tax=Thelazia callipaeda TaxID=103827 RepID=A0A0N5DAW4_THECL|nr:unnamed protein product [Thelazia callipaeda]
MMDSERNLRKALETAYNGIKFNVLCTQNDFGYSIQTKLYCKVIKNGVSCLVFR